MTSASHVQIVDGGRTHTNGLPKLPDQPAGILFCRSLTKEGGSPQLVHRRGRERVRLRDGDTGLRDRDSVTEEAVQVVEIVHGNLTKVQSPIRAVVVVAESAQARRAWRGSQVRTSARGKRDFGALDHA